MESLSSDVESSLLGEPNAAVDELIRKLRELGGESSEVVEELRQLEAEANRGDVSAMHHLGRVRQYGLSDLPEAIKWYGNACKKGDIESADELRDLIDGSDQEDVRNSALVQLREATDAGAKPAALRIARVLEQGMYDGSEDVGAALELYGNLSMDGSEDAAEGLGRIAINNECDAGIRESAVLRLREAGEGGNGCASFLLAGIYEEGSGVVATDVHEAVRLYGVACKGEDWWVEDSVFALDRLAKGIDAMESGGEVAEEVRREALQQLASAAKNRNAFAALRLANIMRLGLEFLEPDLGEAVDLYGIACWEDGDDVPAARELARVIRAGTDILSAVKSKALQHLRDAADIGISQAAFELAYIMEDGADDVPVDLGAAVEIYGILSLVDEGHAPRALVRMAESGNWFPEGVKQAAVQKLRNAANEGNATAKIELARLMFCGSDFFPPDFNEAVTLYGELIKESPFDSTEALGNIARGGGEIPSDAKNRAFQELSHAVDEDVLTAKCEVALTMHQGTGSVPADISKAVGLYGELCTKLVGGAAEQLALIAKGGSEILTDTKNEAVQHLIKATRLGFAPAIYEMARIMEEGTATAHADLHEAVRLYGLANRKEHSGASSALFRLAKGVDVKDERTTVPDDIQVSALQQLQEAAKDGDDYSALRVAELAEKGTESLSANVGHAIGLYGELAISLDYDAVEALVRIARNVNRASLSAAQQQQACEMLQEASENENEYAALMLARVIEAGTPSIPQDLNKAVALYINGCQQGNQAATESLGRIVCSPDITDQDIKSRAFSTLQNEEKLNNRGAMIQVAEILEVGANSIPADLPRSLDLYRNLCQMGIDEVMNFKATIAMGRLARSPDGIAKEAKVSLERTASRDSNNAALEVLAAVLVNGKEEDQDMERAIRIYRTIARIDLTVTYSANRQGTLDQRLLRSWNWKRKFLGKLEVDAMKSVIAVLGSSNDGGEGERAVNARLAWLFRKKIEALGEGL